MQVSMSKKDILQGALTGVENLLDLTDAERKSRQLRELDAAANSFKYVESETVANGFKTVTSGVTDVVSQVQGSVPDQASYALGVVQLDKSAAKSELVKVVSAGDKTDFTAITGNSKLSGNGFLDVSISAPFPEAIAEVVQTTTNLKPDQIKAVVNKNINTELFTDGTLDTVLGDVIKSSNSISNVLNTNITSIVGNINTSLGKVDFGFGSLLENLVEQSFQPTKVNLDSIARIGDVVKTVSNQDLQKIVRLKKQGKIEDAADILQKYSDSPRSILIATVNKIDNRASKVLEPEPLAIDIPTSRTDNFVNIWREAFTDIYGTKIFSPVIRTVEIETELANLRREVTEVVVQAGGVEEGHYTIEDWHRAFVEEYSIGFNPHFYITKYGVIHRGRPLEVETFDGNINKVPRSIRILLEAPRAPLASKTMREFKKLLGSIYRAKPGIQVFGFNQVEPGEENPFFDVPRYIKNTFDKYNVPDYNPSKEAPLTQKELIDRRG